MWLNLRSRSDKHEASLINAAWSFISKTKARVTKSTLLDTLKSHPEYPSLLTISDAFRQWNIDHTAVTADVNRLGEIPVPFIAYMEEVNGQFATVLAITDSSVTLSDYNLPGKAQTISIEAFLEKWRGVTLVAEVSNSSGEKKFREKRWNELSRQAAMPAIVLGSLVTLVLFLALLPNGFGERWLLTSVLSLLLFAGALVSGLLLWYEIDQSNPLLQQICSAGKKTSCSAVLQSSGAKLLGLVSWSEIGFVYFTGSFLFLLLSADSSGAINLLAWINALALPYIVYSLTYQWLVTKQWCPLCLTVQAILLVEFVTLYFLFWNAPVDHHLQVTFALLPSFAIPVFFWLFTKPILQRSQAAEGYKTELNRIKQNKEVFQAILEKQERMAVEPGNLGIVLGNPLASNTIIKVCNPYCNPCAKAHPAIEQLIKNNDTVKVQIIFTPPDDDADRRAAPVRHFMAINGKNDHQLIQNALDYWYLSEDKNYTEFAKRYPVNGELSAQGGHLTAMHEWCASVGIQHTPTFYINGRRLPDLYSVADLEYFLIT